MDLEMLRARAGEKGFDRAGWSGSAAIATSAARRERPQDKQQAS